MRAEIKYIPFETFQDIIVKSGLQFEELAGFIKISGQKGRKVYIPRTQRVGRVDISGFEYPGSGVTNLGDDSFGGVKQQLDFTGAEEATLENFINVLHHMAQLPAVEPATRSARGSQAGNDNQGQQASSSNGNTGRQRRGRPSMMTMAPEPGPSVQERKQQEAQAARSKPAPKQATRPTRRR